MVLPLGSRNVMSRPLQGLAPLAVKAIAVLFDVLDSSQAEFQRGWLQRAKHFSRHQIIQCGGCYMSTRRVHRQTPILSAVIACLLIVILTSHHTTIAFPTNNQARKQSDAPLRNAPSVVVSAILLEAFLIRQISVPGDVSG